MRPGLIAAVLAALVVSVLAVRWYVWREQARAGVHADRLDVSDHTAAATGDAAATTARRAGGSAPLIGIPAIRHFFRTNETPVYFVSATAFNLLGIDRWVRNFKFVNFCDSFDGWHPNVLVPKEQSSRAFSSIEEICNYLLGHKEVVDYVARTRPGWQGGLPDVR